MSFLQKRRAVLAGTCICSHSYKAAFTAAFLLYLVGCADAGRLWRDSPAHVGQGGSERAPIDASSLEGPNFDNAGSPADAKLYVWPGLQYRPADTIEARIAAPPGARRVPVGSGTFEEWLRGLPLKSGRPPVRLFDGRIKPNQEAHHAVIDIDTGKRDLQQCADAMMRLRSEYLFAVGETERIRFRFTDESEALYSAWARGHRPQIRERRKTRWIRKSAPDSSYTGFRAYLRSVFTYAGTYSLSRESRRVAFADMRIGDFFIQGGFPGHAVIIVDMAEASDAKSGEGRRKYILLAQSYMPAQDMHVLRNPAGESPWYAFDVAEADETSGTPGSPIAVHTPEWNFTSADLMRFRE